MARKVATNSWRTVRFFLDDAGVSEVMFDGLGTSNALRCTCLAFLEVGGCQHTLWALKSGAAAEVRKLFRDSSSSDVPSQGDWRTAVLGRFQVTVL